MNHRTPRLIGALVFAAALATSSFSGAVAKTPSGAAASAVAVPGDVSSGDYVAFLLTFTNNGPSNISSLFLLADTPTGATYEGVIQQPSYATCSAGGTGTSLLCSFGAVNVGTSFQVTTVYRAPNITGQWSVNFHFNSTGTTGGNSHGADIAAPTGTVNLQPSGDCAEGFAVKGALNIAGNAVSRNNRQSTAVDASGLGLSNFPLQVSDGPGGSLDVNTVVYPGSFDCTGESAFSEVSTLNVGDNQLFTGGTFRATIVVYQGPSPNQVNGLCWTYLDTNPASPTFNELVVRALTNPHDLCNDPTAPTNYPCFLLNKVGANLQIILISNHNGKINGW